LEQCSKRNGLVQLEEAVQHLVDPITELKTQECYIQDHFTIFEMSITKTQTKPQCHSPRNEGLFNATECTIQTVSVFIFLKLIKGSILDVSYNINTIDFIQIDIPGAVLTTKLMETAADNGTSPQHILQLADLSIQNIFSIIDARRRSISIANVRTWKTWALVNTKRLLRKAFIERGGVQCQW
uniref:Methyltransf_21 domain-containing protein n=1 Tax=Schistocephalus solidus TaxID=70667 RepID=A0A183SC21_SCHSO